MRPTAHLINASRGPVVGDTALLDTLLEGRMRLPPSTPSGPSRRRPIMPFEATLTCWRHRQLGDASLELYRIYGDTVRNIVSSRTLFSVSGSDPADGLASRC
jgi:hypothetical protein